jgi:uncharacterized damage-inducible protein DinB
MRKEVLLPILLALLFLSATETNAQQIKPIDIKNELIKNWERAKIFTNAYLDAMPADKYLSKPTESTKSFAQQMMHLAEGNFYYVSVATDQKAPQYNWQQLSNSYTGQCKDSVKHYVNISYDFCVNAIKALDDVKLGDLKEINDSKSKTTRLTIIMAAFEHQTHHRGQTAIYIRLQGIKPPEQFLF